jgi:hypothetical protein
VHFDQTQLHYESITKNSLHLRQLNLHVTTIG